MSKDLLNNLDLRSKGFWVQRALILSAMLICAASSAVAQGNRVCLYERVNYSGNVFCLSEGDNGSDLQRLGGAWTERLGSIRVQGNVRATLFEGTGFQGNSFVVDSDIPSVQQLRSTQLSGWRRVAGSIRIERRGSQGSGQGGDSRACLYSQSNFNGQSICFNIGEDSADLRRARGAWNGRLGSIRLFGNTQVTIYESTSFGGASYVLSTDVPDFARFRNSELRNWRGEVASLRVDGRRGIPDRPDRPGRSDRACLYDQSNYGGQSVCFSIGDSISELRLTSGGWNDRAISVRLFGDVQATIYENVAFAGASYVVTSDIPDLAQVRLGRTRGNFARQVSAITVERATAAGPVVTDAYRLGQQDAQQGKSQNYRNYRGSYDRNTEADFERDYNRGYLSVRDGATDTTEVLRSLNGGYSGRGEVTIGNRRQQLTDLLIRLRQGGAARLEAVGEGSRLVLTGNWVESTRGQIDLNLSDSTGNSGIQSRGRLLQRNGNFQRLELSGQARQQNFSLNFRDDDSAWGGGGWTGGSGGRPVDLPTGNTIHQGSIISVASGKGLDVSDMSRAEGASVQQWDYNRQPNQTWQVIDLGSGEVAIIAMHSNKALTVQGGRDLNGANVVQREWRNNRYQRWRLEQVGNGVYRIVSVASGKVLDVAGQSLENGANIQQWDYANQANQQWRLGR